MGESHMVVCSDCGHRFRMTSGPGMKFLVLHCDKCGCDKGIGFDAFGTSLEQTSDGVGPYNLERARDMDWPAGSGPSGLRYANTWRRSQGRALVAGPLPWTLPPAAPIAAPTNSWLMRMTSRSCTIDRQVGRQPTVSSRSLPEGEGTGTTTRGLVGRGLLLVTTLAACTEWHVEPANPRQVVNATHPSRIRITHGDSAYTVVDGPSIQGDSLLGRVHGSLWTIALPNVTSVAVQRVHGAHTAMLAASLAAVTAGTIATMTDNGGPSSLRN